VIALTPDSYRAPRFSVLGSRDREKSCVPLRSSVVALCEAKSMDALQTRYRLHAVTWFAGSLLSAGLFVLGIDGKHVLIIEPPQVGWYFGWPLWFGHQHFSHFDDIHPTGPWLDAKYFQGFSSRALAIDVMLAVALVGSVMYLVEKWCRRYSIRPRITLKHLLSFIAWSACYATIEPIWPTSAYPFAEQIRIFATVVTYAGLAIAWLAAFELADAALKRISENTRSLNVPGACTGKDEDSGQE
jgi:hypothetical protein